MLFLLVGIALIGLGCLLYKLALHNIELVLSHFWLLMFPCPVFIVMGIISLFIFNILIGLVVTVYFLSLLTEDKPTADYSI